MVMPVAYAAGMTNQLVAVIGLVLLALLLAAGWVFFDASVEGMLGIVVGLIGGILVPSPVVKGEPDALKPPPPAEPIAKRVPGVPND